MTRDPTVSVLVTVYDQERYVEQALDSVAAQTYDDFQLIVIDDCSRDRSAEVVRAWLERTGTPATFVVNERNRGICGVRNQGLALSRARFVTGLAADDWYEPRRLERMAGTLASLPEEVALLYADLRVCDADGNVVLPSILARRLADGPPPEGRVFDELLRRNFVPAPAVMTRRSALDAVGPYDESLVYEDYDMWLRLADRFELRCLPEVVGTYRRHERSLSNAPGARDGRGAVNEARVLLKWLGRSSEGDRVIAARVRKEALRCAPTNRSFARDALRRVESVDGGARWRLAAGLLALPGGGRALARARGLPRTRGLMRGRALFHRLRTVRP